MAEAGRSAQTSFAGATLPHPVWIGAAVGIACLLLFAVFLIASFPYDDEITRMLAPHQLKLVYAEQHMSLPIGVEFESVSLYSDDQTPRRLLLQSPAVKLAPVITSLILARPQLKLSAQIYGGSVQLKVRQNAAAIDTDFRLDGVSLAESRPLRQFGVALGGSVSSLGSASLLDGGVTEDKGVADFSGVNLTIEITRGFPQIRLGSVDGHLELTGGVLAFREVAAHGGDVEARASGEIQLAPDLAESTIAARLYLTPTASGREHFGIFFNMLPHPPSEGPYDVRGRLMSPSIS
jgi:type II secretion system protein N